MAKVLRGAVAEAIPQCSDCVFLPFCGADPIDSHARQQDEIGHRPSSEFCKRQMRFFEFIFERWDRASAQERAVMRSWARPSRAEAQSVAA
jgi:hypothetical protein